MGAPEPARRHQVKISARTAVRAIGHTCPSAPSAARRGKAPPKAKEGRSTCGLYGFACPAKPNMQPSALAPRASWFRHLRRNLNGKRGLDTAALQPSASSSSSVVGSFFAATRSRSRSAASTSPGRTIHIPCRQSQGYPPARQCRQKPVGRYLPVSHPAEVDGPATERAAWFGLGCITEEGHQSFVHPRQQLAAGRAASCCG